MAKQGLIPSKFSKIAPPICLSCQLGKQHKVTRTSDNKIVQAPISKPGQLVHMDQAESSTPGRPMALSGWNNTNKITCFIIYVDSISKHVYTYFQTSTNAKQTLEGKHNF